MASSGSLTFHKRSTLTVFKFKSTWRASDPKKRPSFNGHPGPSPGSIPTQHFKRIPAFRQKFRQCQKVARIQRNDQLWGRKFLKNGIWQQYRITLFVFKPPIICPWSCHNAMLPWWGIMSFLYLVWQKYRLTDLQRFCQMGLSLLEICPKLRLLLRVCPSWALSAKTFVGRDFSISKKFQSLRKCERKKRDSGEFDTEGEIFKEVGVNMLQHFN